MNEIDDIMIRDGGRYKNLRGSSLKDLELFEGKPNHYFFECSTI